VTHARDRDPIELGHLYVAPPDRHLLVHDGELRLVRGPRENNHRPAVDPLFRSAAASYGSRVVGVVLSGSLDDGAAGMQAIARVRGVRIVQDPDEALYRGMPESAIMADAPDYVIPLAEISAIVTRLASEPIEEVEAGMENGELERENRFTVLASGVEDEPSGRPSLFSCPECSGVLFETDDKGLLRYRCRIGHAYNVESLHAAQSNEIDAALGAALRALEERAVLSRRLAERLSRSGAGAASRRYAARADEAEESATLLRRVMAAQSGAADEGTGS
jgi:two-component system chemotaxis response regulator CheB